MPNPFNTAQFLKSAARLDQAPPDTGREAAFAGRSNAGKSSALNAISGHKGLARTSKTPGRTQLINFFAVTPEARLVDLPGYGYAKMAKAALRAWRDLLEGYLADRPTLALVALLVDARRGLEEEELQLLAYLAARRTPVAIVATKVDRLKKSERKLALAALGRQAGVEVIGTSAEDRTGIDRLCEVAARACGFGTTGTPAPARR